MCACREGCVVARGGGGPGDASTAVAGGGWWLVAAGGGRRCACLAALLPDPLAALRWGWLRVLVVLDCRCQRDMQSYQRCSDGSGHC